MSGPVLDACALIALLRNEPGADRVAELLEANPVCAIGAVNLAEVLYDAARHDGQAMARSILADIRALPIEIVARVDDELLPRGRSSNLVGGCPWPTPLHWAWPHPAACLWLLPTIMNSMSSKRRV